MTAPFVRLLRFLVPSLRTEAARRDRERRAHEAVADALAGLHDVVIEHRGLPYLSPGGVTAAVRALGLRRTVDSYHASADGFRVQITLSGDGDPVVEVYTAPPGQEQAANAFDFAERRATRAALLAYLRRERIDPGPILFPGAAQRVRG